MIKTKARKKDEIEEEITDLKNEVGLLRSIIIGILGDDEEGEYRQSFVSDILKSAREKPTHTFNSPKSLLAELKRA
jgi:hypothetical protein